MEQYKYIYGPVPSRRLGISLGVSPIPEKTCNYSCLYCQLGRTNKLINTRKNFFKVNDIIDELKEYMKGNATFNIITIVGEGEPTLYLKLGELIEEIKKITDIPIAVITNGSLFSEKSVRDELMNADFVLPSLDAYNEETFKLINRPHGSLNYKSVLDGLITFSKEYKGKLYLETMILKDINDNEESILEFKKIIDLINYDRIYINVPARPPAESYIKKPSKEIIDKAITILKGISIEQLVSSGFHSEITDDYAAIKSIIKRHPMNQYEIKAFLDSRDLEKDVDIFNKLLVDEEVELIEYKNYITYRLK